MGVLGGALGLAGLRERFGQAVILLGHGFAPRSPLLGCRLGSFDEAGDLGLRFAARFVRGRGSFRCQAELIVRGGQGCFQPGSFIGKLNLQRASLLPEPGQVALGDRGSLAQGKLGLAQLRLKRDPALLGSLGSMQKTLPIGRPGELVRLQLVAGGPHPGKLLPDQSGGAFLAGGLLGSRAELVLQPRQLAEGRRAPFRRGSVRFFQLLENGP